MKKIVLISCSSKKNNFKTSARNLYSSTLFKLSLEYAEKLNPDNIFILSAKHHLVELDTELEPYNVTLSYISPEEKKKKPTLEVLSKNEVKKWGEVVLQQLKNKTDLENNEFIILAGESYIQPLKSGLKNYKEPLKGIVQGKRPAKLKQLIIEINE